ncbi:MAG: DUF4430 domain-containing protein [Phycisphaerales bacterium]
MRNRVIDGGWLGGVGGIGRVAGLCCVLALATISGSLLAESATAQERAEPVAEGAKQPAALTVRLIIDFNNGAQRVYTNLAWQKDMTVLDALRQASEHPNGFELEFRGAGETAFITAIDGVANERGGRESKNWLFWVNTQFSNRSAGVSALAPGDVVLWRYDLWSSATGGR